MLKIKQATHIDNYKIFVEFSNKEKATVDLKKTIFDDKRQIFQQLKNVNNFKNFKLHFGTINWFNDLDIAPEYLYWTAFKNKKTLQEKFKQWGYESKNQT